MCGFCGFVNFRNNLEENLNKKNIQKMLNQINFRGPDKSNTWDYKNKVFFGVLPAQKGRRRRARERAVALAPPGLVPLADGLALVVAAAARAQDDAPPLAAAPPLAPRPRRRVQGQRDGAARDPHEPLRSAARRARGHGGARGGPAPACGADA